MVSCHTIRNMGVNSLQKGHVGQDIIWGLYCGIALALKSGQSHGNLVRQSKPIQQTLPDEESSPPSETRAHDSVQGALCSGPRTVRINHTNKVLTRCLSSLSFLTWTAERGFFSPQTETTSFIYLLLQLEEFSHILQI